MSRQADKDVRVALTFDFDACCAWIGSMGATLPCDARSLPHQIDLLYHRAFRASLS